MFFHGEHAHSQVSIRRIVKVGWGWLSNPFEQSYLGKFSRKTKSKKQKKTDKKEETKYGKQKTKKKYFL